MGVLFLCNIKQAVPEVCQVSRGARARDRAWVCQVWKHKVVIIYLHRLHWGDFKCTGFTASKVFFSVHLLLKRHMWLIINRAIPPTRGPLQSGFGSFLIPVNSTAHGGSVTRGVGWGKVRLLINNNLFGSFTRPEYKAASNLCYRKSLFYLWYSTGMLGDRRRSIYWETTLDRM